MISEKDLIELNKEAYAVDPDFKDKNGKSLKQIQKDDILKIDETGGQYQVLATENGDYGFQGMAVVPVVNGKPDYSQVTVVSAGTYPSDKNDLFAAAKGMSPNGSPQGDIAVAYVGELISNNPNWKITQLTGYSQSGYMLKAGAHFGIPTTVFSGWFQYRSLSKEEEDFMKANPHLFLNYRQKNDPVTKWNDFNSKWGNSADFGTIIWLDGDSHDLTSWTFNERGQIVIPKNSKNTEAQLKQAESYLMMTYFSKLKALEGLKSKFSRSGGGLSRNEQIYLDDSQAQAVVETASSEFQLVMTNVVKIYQDGIREAEELWQEALTASRNVSSLLEEWEMKEALDRVGCSENVIVQDPCELYQEKLAKAKEMSEKFDALANEIRTSLAKLVQTDQELAQQL
ncbi:hypothetical protein [Enterococcus rivorum]|uniref:Uncharacterized protein n=1 Tax=Enterococcus rivorum TaxID=762845 RepID=A0A1E5KZK7_9ENTE|nr:hypothetical protein [Enterococcus rivorum]MBP2097681.1 hypothetical protein [Enterococcus rivorum]OEH83119.1 hypothetical protein BCR26_02290 [Enterococcus rivorum]